MSQPRRVLFESTVRTVREDAGLAGAARTEGSGVGPPRKKLGQLEAEVLAVLAGAESSLSAAQLRQELDGNPAYTTVNTVLFRLLDKGMVERSQRGRAYVYRLLVDESELVAERMFGHLRVASNPSNVLNQFVHGLSSAEERDLRNLLNGFEE